MKPSRLDPDRWRRIDELFDAALDLPPADRSGFLERACHSDPELRSHVEALIRSHESMGDRFAEPPSPPAPWRASTDAASGPAGQDGSERRVGPFRILREIGRGGMGVVFEAEDTRLGRHVALKALPPYLGVGPAARDRFVSEAQAVAALDHPNIATLFEIDATEDGQLYMAFAFYEGETLADRIARGPLPTDEAVSIAAGVAAGLGAAHAQGIVHRDVKPSNVLLTERGEVKLLDFGVAKVAGGDVTRDGSRLGTVAYMSPEQARGRGVDFRSDLWSLGVVLYEMLTGVRPFTGEDQEAMVRAIQEDDPDFDPLGPGVPEHVVAVVRRLLSKEPGLRYPEVAGLLADLGVEQPPGAEGVTGVAAGIGLRGRSGAGVRVRQAGRNRVAAGIGALVLLSVVAWGAVTAVRRSLPGAGVFPERSRIAVLPLADLTGEPGRDHLVLGMHEAMIAELSRLGALDVISRTSVMRYGATRLSIPEIAGELGVDAIVEGSVAMAGDSLAITAQLIDAQPERHLWTGRYERGVGGLYEVGAEVARSVAAAVEVNLSAADESRLGSARTVNAEAYDTYLRGRVHMDRRNPEGFVAAQNHFRRAIELDPEFVPAYTGLAETVGSAAIFGLRPPHQSFPQARELAETAREIDPSVAEAHYTLAAVSFYYDWDWAEAERSARLAIALNPSDAPAHRLLAETVFVTRRWSEATGLHERATGLDRLSPVSDFVPVLLHYLSRDYDRAIERARRAVEFHAGFWQLHWLLCLSLAAEGQLDQAAQVCEQASGLSGGNSRPVSGLAYSLALAGRQNEARDLARQLEARMGMAYVGEARIAAIYGALGESDLAFSWLERAHDERDVLLIHLQDWTFFDPLRDDPRFDALMARMKYE